MKVIQDMYKGMVARIKTIRGRIAYFVVKVRLHQGSELIPLIYIIVMDVFAEETRTKPFWTVIFVDD